MNRVHEINLLKAEAEELARVMSSPDQQWEAYLADSFFYRVRPAERTRADSIADFVETLLMLESQGR